MKGNGIPNAFPKRIRLNLTSSSKTFWDTEHDATLEAFFYEDIYCLDTFTKEEIIYMRLNGDIPFKQIHFSKADECFAKARAEADMKNKLEEHYLAAKYHDRI